MGDGTKSRSGWEWDEEEANFMDQPFSKPDPNTGQHTPWDFKNQNPHIKDGNWELQKRLKGNDWQMHPLKNGIVHMENGYLS